MTTLEEAIGYAVLAVKKGDALDFEVDGGVLTVETDQGWSVWFPVQESDYDIYGDYDPYPV